MTVPRLRACLAAACLTTLAACGDDSTGPTTGSLAVPSIALPAGVQANVSILGPGGFSRTLTAPDTLEALAAGMYLVIVGDVVADGNRYAGTPPSQQLTVRAGQLAEAAPIAYGIASARLSVEVAGLPPGTGGAITVTGPGGYTITTSTTRALDLLAPGAYTIAAAAVDANGRTWRPDPSTQSVTLTASTIPVVTRVDYGAGTGTLEILVSGLPAGVAAGVRITGPNGYARRLTSADTLRNLDAGSYALSADTVGSNLTTHAPLSAPPTVDVTDNATAGATILYGSAPLELRLALFAEGLTAPVFLTAPPGDARQFIVERNGIIRIVENGAIVPTPFLDIRSRVNFAGERGMLSMAFDPQYATSGLFYVYYVDHFGDMVIERFTSTPGSNVAGASAGVVMTIVHRGENHHGGLITFGPDGMFYIAPGDGGCCGDPQNNAQRTASLLGKILRIDVRTTPYTIPADNPYRTTTGARPEIWAIGLRNPWRYSFDTPTGLLYIGDVGDNAREEVTIVRATQGGINYGWRLMEGSACFNPSSGCNSGALTLPTIEYAHNEGCSITGGYVYRGARIPELVGHYLYADFCRGWIRSVRATGPGQVTDQRSWDALTTPLIVSFGVDGAGELYVITTSRVYRVLRR